MSLEPTLAKLLEAWQDGGLSESENAELLRMLADDPGLRRRFAEQVAMLGAVRATAEQNPRWLALFDLIDGDGRGEGAGLSSFDAATMERIVPMMGRAWYRHPAVQSIAAVVAILLAGSFLLKPRWTTDSGKTVDAPAGPMVSALAVVIGASPDAGRPEGTYLKPGVISQSAGWLTLQTLNGVSVTLDAPFEAELLDHDRIRLNAGRARVRVPEGAEGFKLDSPAFDVVDLGTEFAAVVNTDGTGTCRVFEGKADVSLLDSIGEVKQTRRLAANESVRVNPSKQDLRVIEEANGDYPEIKQPPRPTLSLPGSYPEEVMAMDPVGYWRFEEIRDHVVADEVADGARLQSASTATIAAESGGNHSGELMWKSEAEFFQIPNRAVPMLTGDFSISLFAQFAWLQNYALISATCYDKEIEGNSFILQSYAAFRRSGLNGTGLHAVLRDPPAWDGGDEVFGNTLLRPLHWHHLAATRRGREFTLYLDGTVVGRQTSLSAPMEYHQIFVGRLNGNASQPRMEARGLVGHIDELAIFSRALTEKEIRVLAVPVKSR